MNAFAHLKVAAQTDVGKKRKNNEDAFGTFPASGVFCVADGMGGGDDGEIASAAVVRAVEEVSERFKADASGGYASRDVGNALAQGLSKASAWICNRAHERKLNGCGSTFVGVIFDPTDPAQALAVHAGDSRLYLLRGRSISQITRDHSVAELMGEKDESKVNPMFRSMVVNGIGLRPKADPEFTPFKVAAGDRVLVCSDGLSRMVQDKKLLTISRTEKEPEAAVKALIGAALDAGGLDNVTAVLVEVGTLPPPVTQLEAPPVPVQESDAETADEPTADGGTTGATGETRTCATLLTGISEAATFGGDSADSEPPAESAVPIETAAPEDVSPPDAEDAVPRGRLGRRRIWILTALAFVGVVAVLLIVRSCTASNASACGPATNVVAVTGVAATRPQTDVLEQSQPTIDANALSAPAAPVVSTNAVRDAVVPPPQPTTHAAAADATPGPDAALLSFAEVCDEKCARAFVRTLKRMVPQDEELQEFNAEAERFLKSARQLALMRGKREAEAAAVDLRVLLLNAESVRLALASRSGDPQALTVLAAWGEILSGDPTQAAAQAACVKIIRALSESSAR